MKKRNRNGGFELNFNASSQPSPLFGAQSLPAHELILNQ